MRNDFCSNYLAHARGVEWKNHKYVAKLKLANGKFFYFYSQAQYDSYMNKMKKRNDANREALNEKFGIKKATPKVEAKKNTTVEDSKSKSKKKSGSSSSSKSSGAKSGKSSSSSKSKSSSEEKAKKGSGSSKQAKESTKKTSAKSSANAMTMSKLLRELEAATAVTTKGEETNAAELKETYGVIDNEVSSLNAMKAEQEMNQKYKDGAYGFISVGDKVYKWDKQGGQMHLYDFQSEKEIPFNTIIKGQKQLISEFSIDDKKDRKKTLAHHGILGMKWGHKNGPPYPLDYKSKSISEKKNANKLHLTDDQKKILKTIAITAGVIGIGAATYYCLRGRSAAAISKLIPRMGSSSPQIKEEANKIIKRELKDTDIVLSKGTELYKAQVDKNFDLSKETGVIYSSYDKLDRIAYRYGLRNWRGNKDRYEATFKSADDLIGPSKDEAKKIFDDLFNSNAEYRDELKNSVAKQLVRAYKENGLDKVLNEEQIWDKAFRYAEESIAKNPFEAGMNNMVSNTNTSKKLVDAFIKEGYDFVEDYMDKNRFTRNPIVLLSNKKVTQQGVEWYNYYNKANRQLAKSILIKRGHGGAYGWSVNNP